LDEDVDVLDLPRPVMMKSDCERVDGSIDNLVFQILLAKHNPNPNLQSKSTFIQ
jgi:hypothetical protein